MQEAITMKTILKKFIADESGATAIEDADSAAGESGAEMVLPSGSVSFIVRRERSYHYGQAVLWPIRKRPPL